MVTKDDLEEEFRESDPRSLEQLLVAARESRIINLLGRQSGVFEPPLLFSSDARARGRDQARRVDSVGPGASGPGPDGACRGSAICLWLTVAGKLVLPSRRKMKGSRSMPVLGAGPPMPAQTRSVRFL